MKAVRAILGAMWTALRREQGSLKVPGNNLFYAAAASAFLLDPAVAGFVAGVVIIVLFFPLSMDPFRLVPRSRLQLWPLTNGQRRLLRAISPWLNPMTWLVVALALWRRVSIGVAALVIGLFLVAFFAPSLRTALAPSRRTASGNGILPWVPRLPGPLGEMIRKDVRGILTTLDFYCALVPAVAALGYRAAGLLPREAFLPGTCMVLLAISTCSQTLFGLDADGGLTRYALLPVAGWRVLLAKDIAFVAVAVVLAAALSPLDALTGSLVALAFGRKPAIEEIRPQLRRCLQTGASFGPAIAQIVAMLGAASFAATKGPLVLMPCAGLWGFSLWWGGRKLDGLTRAR